MQPVHVQVCTYLCLIVVSTTPPSSASSTGPATLPDAPTTPKGVLRAFVEDILSGDFDGALTFVEPDDATAKSAVLDYLKMCAADLRLERVANERFGADRIGKLLREQHVLSKPLWREVVLDRIEEAREQIDGERIVIVIDHPRASPWPMRRVDGHWKIAWAAQDAREMGTVAQRTDQIADDIEGGNIEVLEQLATALDSRLIFIGGIRHR